MEQKTEIRVANFCYYSDLVIQPISHGVVHEERIIFQELFYFGRYRDDYITIWTGDVDKVNS